MKFYLRLFVLIWSSSSIAFAGDCGLQPIKPIPPLGCKDTTPVCQCDSNDQCQWVFECVPDEVAELKLVKALDFPKSGKAKIQPLAHREIRR